MDGDVILCMTVHQCDFMQVTLEPHRKWLCRVEPEFRGFKTDGKGSKMIYLEMRAQTQKRCNYVSFIHFTMSQLSFSCEQQDDHILWFLVNSQL